MARRFVGLIMMLSFLGGCSLIFDSSKVDEGKCEGCTDGVGNCFDPPVATNCGVLGGICTPCDELKTDTCVNGRCRCGDGPACGLNRECMGGECKCTGRYCTDGCCSEQDVCRVGDSELACGEGGNRCVSCNKIANACAPSVGCRCGDNPACAPGQHCDGNDCVCNSESCADGCCDNDNNCVTVDDTDSCGTAGQACDDCGDEMGVDIACTGGVCATCAADCDDGCCSGKSCIAATSDNATACNGVDGLACTSCGIGADGCNANGDCECGGGLPCGPGLECNSAGTCECSPASCAGCCDAGVCRTQSDTSCGLNGAPCDVCETGEDCYVDVGVCECNESTCPGGCCDIGLGCVQAQTNGNDCIINGGECLMCGASERCNPETESCDIIIYDAGPADANVDASVQIDKDAMLAAPPS